LPDCPEWNVQGAQAQRAAILHLLGLLDEATDGYRIALPVLRRTKDLLWVQRY
jgi:hypothetical protein